MFGLRESDTQRKRKGHKSSDISTTQKFTHLLKENRMKKRIKTSDEIEDVTTLPGDNDHPQIKKNH